MSKGRLAKLRRRPPRIEPRPRVLIVCEGEATELGYFRTMRREVHIRTLDIEFGESGAVPKTLVERAVAFKKEAQRLAKRSGDSNLLYDEVWCVFDRDTHPHLPEAFQQAQANSIKVAFSNPCFELWILLHFRDQRAHFDSAAARHACREFLPKYEKHVSYADLQPRYGSAIERAKQLDQWQESRGCSGENPSTTVYRLTERLHELGRAAQLARVSGSHRRDE